MRKNNSHDHKSIIANGFSEKFELE